MNQSTKETLLSLSLDIVSRKLGVSSVSVRSATLHGPSAWNALFIHVRDVPNSYSFRKLLKNSLF